MDDEDEKRDGDDIILVDEKRNDNDAITVVVETSKQPSMTKIVANDDDVPYVSKKIHTCPKKWRKA